MSGFCQHHPDDNLLTEFAAGSLSTAEAIAVSAHLHYCPRCRHQLAKLNAIGGALLSLGQPTETKTSDKLLSFDQLMTAIDERENHDSNSHPPQALPTKESGLPSVVKKMISTQEVEWKHVTASLKSANLVSGQNQYGVYLQKIAAGGKVPEHNHQGREITVVLKGSISDEDGVYQQGDFIFKQTGDIHRPRASSNEDCLCLSIQEAPVQLTGTFSRFLNPFLSIKAV